VKPKPPARNPYLSQNELKALGRLMGALRPAKLATVRGAEIFQAGVRKGERYTVADLDDMARNFKLARGVIDPPLVTGHDEEQAFLEGSGLPAAGWLVRVYRRGAKLFGDFGGVPRSIAKLINARAYKKVSVEIYDEDQHPEDTPAACKGKIVRRVALLGAELPQVKTLADLPLAEYSERPPVCRPWRLVGSVDCVKAADGKAVRVTRFAEGATMAADETTAAMVSAIKAAEPDLSDEFLASLTADQLTILLTDVSGGGPEAAEPAAGDGGAAAQAEWPEGVTRESAIADLVAAGEDQATLDAMSDDEVLALWQEKVGGAAPMSETRRLTATSTGATIAFNPRRFAEVEARLARAERQARALERDNKRLAADRAREAKAIRQRTVEAYCERWAREGYVLPRDVDRTAKVPNLYNRLLNADASKVKKFGEKSMTDFDSIVAEVEDRGPGFVRKFFSEKLAQPEGAKDGLHDVTEAAKKYAESRNGQAKKRA
jgi:hypothetical protein